MSLTAVAPESVCFPFSERGPLSHAVLAHLTGAHSDRDLVAIAHEAILGTADVIRDDDIQAALFALYGSAYGAFDQFVPDMEWDTQLIATRKVLESHFESALREAVSVPETPERTRDGVARALRELTQPGSGPSLARFMAKKATVEQAREVLVNRTIYTLREADPHSWAIPRLQGRPKAALVEIQADEYGGGDPERMHAVMFATTLRAMGLDDTYGTYVDHVPAITLASHNTMSMFGVNRRLLGAIVGHLAAFEMTSSIPSRLYADGFRRLGYGPDVTDYFDEHVEADAVHEQIASHDLAGCLAEDRPELLEDIMFGAAACLTVDGWVESYVLDALTSGGSPLRKPLAA